jgi:hypothetical protein
MSLIDHHIYEFKKNVRSLFLHTIPVCEEKELIEKLEREGIIYYTSRLSDNVSNIFFGDQVFVKVVERFGHRKMNELTIEEDFILGIMLGYGQKQQCERYLSRKLKEKAVKKGPCAEIHAEGARNEREMQMQR